MQADSILLGNALIVIYIYISHKVGFKINVICPGKQSKSSLWCFPLKTLGCMICGNVFSWSGPAILSLHIVWTAYGSTSSCHVSFGFFWNWQKRVAFKVNFVVSLQFGRYVLSCGWEILVCKVVGWQCTVVILPNMLHLLEFELIQQTKSQKMMVKASEMTDISEKWPPSRLSRSIWHEMNGSLAFILLQLTETLKSEKHRN